MSDFLSRRGFNVAKFEAMPHGLRAKYSHGCRCVECRRANTEYEKRRNYKRQTGDWNGLVSAARARRHLAKLSAAGVGRRSVRDACRVSETVLQEIQTGRKLKIRARTHRSILDCLGHHATLGRFES